MSKRTVFLLLSKPISRNGIRKIYCGKLRGYLGNALGIIDPLITEATIRGEANDNKKFAAVELKDKKPLDL